MYRKKVYPDFIPKNTTLGQRIRLIRKYYGMTQKELSYAINGKGCSAVISTWESNRSLPQIYDIADMCKVFHITVEQLLEGNIKLPNMKYHKGIGKIV